MKKQFKQTGIQAFIVFWSLILVSCATQSILIEVPQQSKNELPDRIQSVLLVSRVVDKTYSNLDADSLQNIFYKHNFDYDTIVSDSHMVDTMLRAMGDLLYSSGRYDYVIPEKRFLPFEKSSLLPSELPWNEVRNLCETYNTDAVISIDHLKTKVSTSYDRESYFNPFEASFGSIGVAKMNVSYEALIRIYDPLQEKVLVRKLLCDTLYWEDNDPYVSELFNRFTPVKNALFEAGVAIALDFSDDIATNWQQERRNFFASGNKDLKQAVPLARSGQWETAMNLWKQTAETSKSKAVKSKAEYNVALAYELQGDIDKAIEWALKSYNTMYRTDTYDYLEILKQRKNEQKKQ